MLAYSSQHVDSNEEEPAFTEKGAITEAFDQENPELAKKAKEVKAAPVAKPKKVVKKEEPKEDEIKLPEKMVSLPTLDDDSSASKSTSDVQNKEQLLDNIVESSLGDTSNEGFFHAKHRLNSLEKQQLEDKKVWSKITTADIDSIMND